MVYNDIFKKLSRLNENTPRYDLIISLPPLIKAVDDGVRCETHLNETWRADNDTRLNFIFQVLFKPKRFIIIDKLDINYRINLVINAIKSL